MLSKKTVKLSNQIKFEITYKKNSKEIANLEVFKNGCSVQTIHLGAMEMKKTVSSNN